MNTSFRTDLLILPERIDFQDLSRENRKSGQKEATGHRKEEQRSGLTEERKEEHRSRQIEAEEKGEVE